MRLLVWHWGRRGAGPRFAADLATSLNGVPGCQALLSMSRQAEIMRGSAPPDCALPFDTYEGGAGLLRRVAQSPLLVGGLARGLRGLRLDVAVCAMPAPLDLLMAAALRRAAVPFWVVVHDADAHPGDGFPLQMRLQRRLVRGAAGVVALSAHVAQRLRGQGLAGAGTRRRLVQASLPPALPLPGEVAMPPPGAHGGPLRLLSFGRLLPYKGLDLLAEALRRIGPRPDLQVRVVGRGPESPPLEALRALPGVVVENRWVAEEEVPVLLGWADALVLSHREASQSGVAVGALAAGRRLVATRVGGLEEQVGDDPLALLCDPTAESIAGALQHLLAAPTRPPAVPRTPERAWSTLAAQIVSALHE